MSTVWSRVVPPAPYVTETYAGSSSFRSSSALRRFSSPSGVFGGKNSNEKTGWSSASICSIRIALRVKQLDVEPYRDLAFAVQVVVHVDRVVFPIGTGDCQCHR